MLSVLSIDRTSSRRWLTPIAAAALLFAILLFIFPYNSGDSSINSPLGLALWTMWTNTLSSASGSDSPDYTYCLLVPAMVLYLLFEKRSQITQTPIRSSNPAIVAILIGLLLFWIGSRAGKQYIGCAGIQILILGIIFWFWGGAMFHRLFFTWAIICFAWPLPFLDTAVAFPLRMIVSRLANLSLNLVGIPSIQNGTALLSAPAPAGLPLGARFQIDIADPCSGLHSLLPLLMFSAFFCYFFLPKPWQQWTVFLTTPLFMIVGNVVRILMLVIGCITWGSSFSIGTGDQPSWFHEGCGFAVFVLVLGLECIFGYSLIALGRRFSDPSTAAAPAQSKVAPPPATGDIPFGRSGIIFTLVLMVAIVYLVTPPVYLPSEAGVLMTLPDQVKISDVDGGDFFGSDAPVSDAEHRLLPKDTEFSRKNYDDFHDHQIFFSIVLSGLQQYTIHPPEICLVAQGWSIVGQEDIPIRLSSGHKLTVRNLSLQREVIDARQQHRLVKAYYMYWYVADDITTPSHTTRNWMSSWDRVVHNRDHRWAYVIAMSPITQTIRSDGLDAEQTRDMLTSFIRQIIPTFQKNEIPGYTDNS